MRNLLLAILVTLMAACSLCAATDPVLTSNNPQTVFMDEGSFLSPLCALGDLCGTNQSALAPGDGSPIPSCDPGKKCNRVDDQLQLRAGDGSPIPSCDPGKKCNRVDDQLQLRAGDGSPIPSCDPGKRDRNDQMAITIVV